MNCFLSMLLPYPCAVFDIITNLMLAMQTCKLPRLSRLPPSYVYPRDLSPSRSLVSVPSRYITTSSTSRAYIHVHFPSIVPHYQRNTRYHVASHSMYCPPPLTSRSNTYVRSLLYYNHRSNCFETTASGSACRCARSLPAITSTVPA